MRYFSALLVPLVFLGGCAASASQNPQHTSRLSFVDSVTPLPDGGREIVVSGQISAASSNGQVQSVNLGERLEQAAKAECNGGPYQLTPSTSTGLAPGKQGPIKLTLKGVVHCG